MNTLKFTQMPYQRPDQEEVCRGIREITDAFKSAGSYEEARDAFVRMDQADRKTETMANLANIRYSIDTRDAFYDAEVKFWNNALPEIEETKQAYREALLKSPFREALAKEFGEVVFTNLELEARSFAPSLIPLMQKENELVQEYDKLLASAQIPFQGGIYTLSQLTPFKTDSDDAVRLAAWKAEGNWFKENQPQLDRIYDDLVHVRDEMGRKLGYENFTELGYDRMQRNCYRKEEVERFREAVRKYLVPEADRIRRRQAERLGMTYPLSFADMALEFRNGNPKPAGDEEEILRSGQAFYDELSPETGAFFRMMRERELLDVTSKEGKQSGGYCEGLPAYGVPFIFANFNGTKGDVEVVTHEAGHAFAQYVNHDRVPSSTIWPGMEACEVHSMSMEFFAWPWAEKFFGEDTDKYLYSHLAGALTFLPYGTMVDHFQHIVYEHPEMTPAQRHGAWKELLGTYMPWVRLDGEIPFYSDGEAWQRQLHIYGMPFYYIDYCLAQTVALEFWAMIQEDLPHAWEKYMAYTEQGGSAVFTELLRKAGLESPFEETCLKGIARKAGAWLEAHPAKD